MDLFVFSRTKLRNVQQIHFEHTNSARSSRRALIIRYGAGIAGPEHAYWLNRAGFEPTIVERAQPRGVAVI